jgi:hypothetical protein
VSAVISAFRHLTASDEAPSRRGGKPRSSFVNACTMRDGAGAHPHRSSAPGCAAMAGGLTLLIGGPIAFFAIAGAYNCTEATGTDDDAGVSLRSGCGDTAVMALLVAFVAATTAYAVTRAVARPRMSGQSDSHKRLFYVAAAAFTWVFLATFLAAAAIGYARR